MGVIKNAWEVESDEHALLALAGSNTLEEFERDRQERAREVILWCSVSPQSQKTPKRLYRNIL